MSDLSSIINVKEETMTTAHMLSAELEGPNTFKLLLLVIIASMDR